MNEYIALSELNDFIFCPYSIYLHQVYWSTDEETYKALPHIKAYYSSFLWLFRM